MASPILAKYGMEYHIDLPSGAWACISAFFTDVHGKSCRKTREWNWIVYIPGQHPRTPTGYFKSYIAAQKSMIKCFRIWQQDEKQLKPFKIKHRPETMLKLLD